MYYGTNAHGLANTQRSSPNIVIEVLIRRTVDNYKVVGGCLKSPGIVLFCEDLLYSLTQYINNVHWGFMLLYILHLIEMCYAKQSLSTCGDGWDLLMKARAPLLAYVTRSNYGRLCIGAIPSSSSMIVSVTIYLNYNVIIWSEWHGFALEHADVKGQKILLNSVVKHSTPKEL